MEDAWGYVPQLTRAIKDTERGGSLSFAGQFVQRTDHLTSDHSRAVGAHLSTDKVRIANPTLGKIYTETESRGS